MFQEAANFKLYVDKTDMIAYMNTVLSTPKKYVCVSRPRRFGKSLTAKMLSAYYDRSCDSSKIFSSLKIGQEPLFRKHMNQYDVLFFNMQQFLSRAGTTEKMLPYLQYAVLKDLRTAYGDYIDPEEVQLVTALESIFSQTQRGFVFIIDEWDCIFREKQKDIQAQKEYLDFLRDLLKDQAYVKLAYMTGILPIKKYGTHSALNMFDEYSMIEPKVLAEYIGFTGQEVEALCEEYKIDTDEMKRWYDGYVFHADLHIYSPKSVVDAIWYKTFHSYWNGTETYEALKVYIELSLDGLQDAIIAMLGGERCKIDAGAFQNDMTTFKNKDDVLTLLVHLGYLAYDVDTKEVSIPNDEVRGEFVRAIEKTGWSETIHSLQASEKLL